MVATYDHYTSDPMTDDRYTSDHLTYLWSNNL
jgi:hypothetical protein